MKKPLLILAALAFAGAASAQQFKWVDKDGKVRYGDVPPPGVKATPMRAPSGPAPAAEAKGAKDKGGKAPAGPLTPAQQEAEFRKRQVDAEKAREKEARAAEEARGRQENCQNAQAHLRQVESGQRIARVDAKGERSFLEDDQRAAEAARARKSVAEWCK
jgi:surface antigen